MEIACYLERDELVTSGKDMIKSILEKEQVSLKNIFLKLKDIGNNTLGYYKDVREVNEFIKECAGIYSLIKLGSVIGLDNLRGLQRVLVSACTTQICNTARCLDVFTNSRVCQEPLPECPTASQNTRLICYEYNSLWNTYYVDCRMCEGEVSKAFGNMYIDSIISSLLESSSEVTKRNVCSYIINLYTESCDVLKKEEISEERIKNIIKRKDMCESIFTNEKLNEEKIGVYINVLEEKRGNGYVELLKNTVAAEKLKELYKKYEQGTICDN
ncbi:MAG: hypothetical protein ACK4NF_04270, partial [Planctomycetota bacterium]